MGENVRFVTNHPHGWAIKKTVAKRPSGVFSTQREAEDRARDIVENLGGGKFAFRLEKAAGETQIPSLLEMIRIRQEMKSSSPGRYKVSGAN